MFIIARPIDNWALGRSTHPFGGVGQSNCVHAASRPGASRQAGKYSACSSRMELVWRDTRDIQVSRQRGRGRGTVTASPTPDRLSSAYIYGVYGLFCLFSPVDTTCRRGLFMAAVVKLYERDKQVNNTGS